MAKKVRLVKIKFTFFPSTSLKSMSTIMDLELQKFSTNFDLLNFIIKLAEKLPNPKMQLIISALGFDPRRMVFKCEKFSMFDLMDFLTQLEEKIPNPTMRTTLFTLGFDPRKIIIDHKNPDCQPLSFEDYVWKMYPSNVDE